LKRAVVLVLAATVLVVARRPLSRVVGRWMTRITGTWIGSS
jgi:hypothetical protein